MKKLISLTLAATLAATLLLSGCDELPSASGNSGDTPSTPVTSGEPSAPVDSGEPSAPAETVSGADLDEGEYVEGGDYGYIGDVMHTYWFNFAINSAYTCTSYGSYTAPADKQLLVVNLSMKNTSLSSVPMSDLDFQAQWGDDADDAYAYAITTDEPATNQVQVPEALSDEQLPTMYDLAINEERSGVLVFEVPAGYQDFSISFQEIFEDNTYGDAYFVFFTAEEQG